MTGSVRLSVCLSVCLSVHDNVIKWKYFPRDWLFVRGIHRSPVNSPHKGQWCVTWCFLWSVSEKKGWVNNRYAGKLRRHCTHYDVTVMLSACLSVFLSHLFNYASIIVSSWNFQELLPMTEVVSMQKVKVRGQRYRSQRSKSNLAVSGPWLQFEFTYDDEMMHKAWCCFGEVLYCFTRSVKFQGYAAKKNRWFWPKLGVSGL